MLLLLELLLLELLLLLYVFYHVLIRGREAPPYKYVVNVSYQQVQLIGEVSILQNPTSSITFN